MGQNNEELSNQQFFFLLIGSNQQFGATVRVTQTERNREPDRRRGFFFLYLKKIKISKIYVRFGKF